MASKITGLSAPFRAAAMRRAHFESASVLAFLAALAISLAHSGGPLLAP